MARKINDYFVYSSSFNGSYCVVFPCRCVDLRLQLLDVENNPYLIKALYGLLMLLPQSQAFQLLSHRLRCVPNPELMRTV